MQNNLKELLDIIFSTAKIEEVISDYVQLQRKGNNYTGLCPFHPDQNPSMSVSPTKNIFKCFSCQAGGNVISFVQNYEGITFIETVKKLSDRYGIEYKKYINDRPIKVDKTAQDIYEVNKEAQAFFTYNLKNELNDINSDITKYVRGRNLTDELIDKFKIGYASEYNALLNYLTKKGFEQSLIVKAGLAKINESDQINDYFINRLIFPISNQIGDIIGFSGRVLQDKTKYAKYLNTAETYVFKKGNFLYNLNNAKSGISLRKEAIIVEGYMDVISYSSIGLNNAVASMGTAFTSKQIGLLSKLTKNIILSFDNDVAGINATIKIGKMLSLNEFNVSVFTYSDAKDMDEYVKKHSEVEILEEIKHVITFLD
jgi:DNA primase